VAYSWGRAWVRPGKVVILGGGVVGTEAARIAVGYGCYCAKFWI